MEMTLLTDEQLDEEEQQTEITATESRAEDEERGKERGEEERGEGEMMDIKSVLATHLTPIPSIFRPSPNSKYRGLGKSSPVRNKLTIISNQN
jgi:hypothetical protein